MAKISFKDEAINFVLELAIYGLQVLVYLKGVALGYK